jgi:alpha,alpha-trehalase
LEIFTKKNFHKAGHELKIVMPKDIQDNPKFLDDIHDEGIRSFAKEIHLKWKSLLRVVDKNLLCKDCESTALDLPYPFIVPGGRFREFYYWDTLWILEGLYVSEMCLTAKSVIENTLWLVDKYGFVPNGSRVYYLNRSQPPVLPMMIQRYLEECGNGLRNKTKFIERSLGILEKEYSFWMAHRSVNVTNEHGSFTLNRYDANLTEPRPESYLHDVQLACNLTTMGSRQNLFHNIAATTESGWDFSGRWLNWTLIEDGKEYPDLRSSCTADLIPIDLNAVLMNNEVIIGGLWKILGNADNEAKYHEFAAAREKAFRSILYASRHNSWRDYNYVQGRLNEDRPFYITDLCPLWYTPFMKIPIEEIKTMLEDHQKIIYDYKGGVPISETYTAQQWDFPNVWAPTQYQLVRLHQRLYEETGDIGFDVKALEIAQKWIDSTYCGYRHYGYIFEKYDATMVGQPGAGGEYIVQEGFGWSNGVILWVIKQYGKRLMVPKECPVHPIVAKALMDEEVDDVGYLPVGWIRRYSTLFGLWTVAGLLTLLYKIWRRRKGYTGPLMQIVQGNS